jgi:leader peptidase (prepilin peptidase)/N-methyltransferase
MSQLLIVPAIFFIGTAIGSFLNVVVIRFPDSAPSGRSHCPQCHKKLTWWELIPVLSFTLLAGRCSRCQAGLSIQYPLVELFYGLVALILFTPFTGNPANIFFAFINYLIICLLGLLFLIDLRTFILPDLYIATTTFIIIILLFITPPASLLSHIFGAVIGSSFFAFLWLLTKGRGIGLGDVKLMIPLGLLFGLKSTLILLLASFIAGGSYGLWLLITKRATLKTAVPFGPFLTAAAIAFIIFPDLPNTIINAIFN